MSMSHDTAQRWVTISAVTVAGIYAYRRLTEGSGPPATIPKLMGIGELPQLGAWATAWGFCYLVVAAIAEASPPLGGSFAILIMTADILTNSSNLFSDVSKQQKGDATATAASSQTATNPLVKQPVVPYAPRTAPKSSTTPPAVTNPIFSPTPFAP